MDFRGVMAIVFEITLFLVHPVCKSLLNPCCPVRGSEQSTEQCPSMCVFSIYLQTAAAARAATATLQTCYSGLHPRLLHPPPRPAPHMWVAAQIKYLALANMSLEVTHSQRYLKLENKWHYAFIFLVSACTKIFRSSEA